MSSQGSCNCGAVKYTVSAAPFGFFQCHCSNCRKASGAACMTNAFLNENEMSITSGESNITTYVDNNTKSGKPVTRKFCKTCGSPVQLSTPSFPGKVGLPAGTVDGTVDWKITGQSFEEDKRQWSA